MYAQLKQRGMRRPPVNVSTLARMKKDSEPIACLTAYDASFARLVDRAGVDLVLVGDSLGMVIQGHDTTVPVTVDHIIYHSKTVARALTPGVLVADMSFVSDGRPEQALGNAGRLMQEGAAMMVKLEGGMGQLKVVEHLARHDIPVCADIGLRPQSVHKIGGFKVHGRDAAQAEEMLNSARRLEDAGADVVLLECVPNELGMAVASQCRAPVIGIGAGPHVDGQILVLYDILGITQGPVPKFVRNFIDAAANPLAACEAYVAAVKSRQYPAPEHCFS